MIEAKIVFADVQGYKSSKDKFVVKEICILNEDFRIHEIIRRPHPFNHLSISYKKQAKWIMNNHHGINWNDGNTSMSKLKKEAKSIINKVDVVLVKGTEKVQWIGNIFPEDVIVRNIENYYQNTSDFYASAHLYTRCRNHKINNSSNHCALQNALLLQKWINEKNKIFFDLS